MNVRKKASNSSMFGSERCQIITLDLRTSVLYNGTKGGEHRFDQSDIPY